MWPVLKQEEECVSVHLAIKGTIHHSQMTGNENITTNETQQDEALVVTS